MYCTRALTYRLTGDSLLLVHRYGVCVGWGRGAHTPPSLIVSLGAYPGLRADVELCLNRHRSASSAAGCARHAPAASARATADVRRVVLPSGAEAGDVASAAAGRAPAAPLLAALLLRAPVSAASEAPAGQARQRPPAWQRLLGRLCGDARGAPQTAP